MILCDKTKLFHNSNFFTKHGTFDTPKQVRCPHCTQRVPNLDNVSMTASGSLGFRVTHTSAN